MVMARLRALAAEIERAVPPIEGPSRRLEQYTTPGELAALVALDAASKLDSCSWAVDLAAGTCRLAAAVALVLGCRVVAVEYDSRLWEHCRLGLERLGVGGYVAFVSHWIGEGRGPLAVHPDLVVTNPPFGVVRKGADWEILGYALSALRPSLAYAILKSGNLGFHESMASRYGYKARLLARSEFPIPASMPRHRSRIRRVAVDVVIFEPEG